jgi:hypothetical protein
MNNGWDEHRISILHRLDKMDAKLDKIDDELVSIQRDLAFSRGRTYTISAFIATIISLITVFSESFWG